MCAPVLSSAFCTICASKNWLNLCVRTITTAAMTSNSSNPGMPISTARKVFFLFMQTCFLLERLPQRYEILRGFHARRGIQVVTDVNPHGANWCVIPKAETDRVGVVADKLLEINTAVNVAAVIKNHAAQAALQRNRKARFGIHYGEHVAPDWHANQRASGRIAWIAAHGHRPLRSRSVDGETAERVAAAGEKTLAQRHVAAGKR